ncbi:cytochrome c biogenesis protein ResB [Kocuria palustris]|uniref:cytochrome c biogenesis protein ResB n=1 Tax=Kocuria palustris TaxID=71999 RepID=UPI003CC82E0E
MNSAQDGASAPAQEHGAGMQEHKGARGARSDRGSTVSTAQKDPGGGSSQDVAVPALGPLGMLRWAWAQLTKMNTALFLLLMLAVAAVPGSIFPQRVQDVGAVNDYIASNPRLGPVLDALQMFDVFSSVWFAAIYLLLFISLVGCVLPRARKHWQAWRAQPPRTPRRFTRLPVHRSLRIGGAEGSEVPTAAELVERSAALLSKRGYRVHLRDMDTEAPSVGAERGMWKEVGNILFHVALLGILIFMAFGAMFGFKGQKILTVGETFANSLISYDSFSPGSNFDADWLAPFTLTVDDFDIDYNRDTEDPGSYGQPLGFDADVTVQDGPDAEPRQEKLSTNQPVSSNGVRSYLIGNGYAPSVRVTDGDGDVAYEGPVITVPEDLTNISAFTLKVPDAQPEQLGFTGTFLPTAYLDEDSGQLTSIDPDLGNPALVLSLYSGDLGLDSGTPQNVYVLDVEGLKEEASAATPEGPLVLSEASPKAELPNGLGEIEYLGTERYVGLDVNYDPGTAGVFVSFLLAFAGLIMSLFIVRRRAWVRVRTEQTPEGPRAVLEYALLARGEDPRLETEDKALAELFSQEWEQIGVVEDADDDAQAPGASKVGGSRA